MRLAIFDIDGTLVAPPSTEKQFAWYIIRRGLLGPRQIACFLAGLVAWTPRFGLQVCKKNKAYLTGLDRDRLSRLAEDWSQTATGGFWDQPTIARLYRHLEDGDEVLLLSGTLDFVAAALAARLGVRRSIGSVCPTKGSRFLFQVPTQHPFGMEKLMLARQAAAALSCDPGNVVAYANSMDDVPLLEWAGVAVAVNPSRRLARHALQRGWRIIDGSPKPVCSGSATT